MLLWRLLSGVDLLILAGYLVAIWKRQERVLRADYLTLPIGLVGAAGLLIYAFSLPPLSAQFWRFFLAIFAASGAWEVAVAVNTRGLNPGTLIGALLALALVGFTQ